MKTRVSLLLVTAVLVSWMTDVLAEGLSAASMESAVRPQQAPIPACVNRPVQGASHNGVALPNLHVEAEFRSKRARHTSEVTLVTQCSFDRLPMLEAQCASWSGITSAAVYWPLFVSDGKQHAAETQREQLETAKAQLAEMHTRLETQEGGCRLDLVLVSEHIQPELLWAYAYNALRNHAVLRAATDVIMLLDVDFVVTAGLHRRLAAEAAAKALAGDLLARRQAVVLPAFETDPELSLPAGHSAALQAVSKGKHNLLRMFRSRSIIQFAEFYPAGHKPTNYRAWFNSTQPVLIKYQVGYEPYLLISRALMPLYDERFRGYGWDKVMHIWQLDAQGFRFVTHPRAWAVHRPHTPSAGYLKSFTGPAYTKSHQGTAHLRQMEKIAKDMMGEIANGTYPERGVSALAACREAPGQPERADKWWRRRLATS